MLRRLGLITGRFFNSQDQEEQEETEMEESAVQPCETGLGDLADCCISCILALTTPKDVCRVAAVSHHFERVANSDTVWEMMLPPNYRDILSKAVSPVAFASRKKLYFGLCDSILIDGGTKRVWVERSTGKVCYMMSARALTITWGETPHYWCRTSRDESRFGEVAHLIEVCWLEIGGRFDCRVLSPNTEYDLAFVVKVVGRHYNPNSWSGVPVRFSLTTECGDVQESARCLVERGGEAADGEGRYLRTPLRHGSHGWMEFVAGIFTVEDNANEPAYIGFRMAEVETGLWKFGLFVDGVKIQPKRD